MSKSGYLLYRIKLLFNSDDIEAQQIIVNRYANKRNQNKPKYRDCYCGHTTDCECANPGISEFKQALFNGTITENDLKNFL